MKHLTLIFTAFSLSIITACNNTDNKNNAQPENKITTIDSALHNKKDSQTSPLKNISYSFIKRKDWVNKKDSFEGNQHLEILNAINRTDTRHLKGLDSILVPSDYSHDVKFYLPFPETIDILNNVNKIIIFSYPAQVFAAYENGKMKLTGPTSMGRKTKQTPQRLYFTNWKAKKTISTVDEAWVLNWNFNVHNTWGVGFHEYDLPGYPASHSCMRLHEEDARFLYTWADQWILKNGQLAASGTPVIVFGKYPFGKTKPWHALVNNPNALTLQTDSLNAYIEPHLTEILKKQEERKSVLASAQ